MTPTYINLLDLKHPEAHNNNNNNLHILFQALRKKTRIVIAAGAGIPASVRVPTFCTRANKADSKVDLERYKHIDMKLLDTFFFSDNERTESLMR